MSGFDYDVKKTRQKLERKKSSKSKTFKLPKKDTKVLLMPPVNGRNMIETCIKYAMSVGSGKQYTEKYVTASPEDIGEEDVLKSRVIRLAIALKDKKSEKNLDSKDKKLIAEAQKNLSKFRAKEENYINVVDLTSKEDAAKGPQPYRAPRSVINAIEVEISDIESLEEISHPDKGKILRIVHDGASGMHRKYTSVSFRSKTAQLIKKGILTEEEILKNMPNLEKFKVKFDKKMYAKWLEMFDEEIGKYEKIFLDADELNNDIDDEEVDDEEVDDEEIDDKEVADSEDSEDELDLDDEEETPDDDGDDDDEFNFDD